ncbi:MAG: type II secretion system F family protein [Firmicutes bacterium]|nr:type II secretion system F family protein [Bacillota bacterium]MBR0481103.1 type II secretion system F family protein [Bacillota bacterium]
MKEKGKALFSEAETPSETDTNLKDYSEYVLKGKEKRDYYITACSIAFVIGMLFYGSIWASLILCCLTPYLEDAYSGHLCEKRRGRLLDEFKDTLYSISASIAAGRQLPRALEDAAMSSEMLKGEDSLMGPELRLMVRKYRRQNSSVFSLLEDLGRRSGIDDIKLFAASCGICLRSGGDLEAVCLKSAYILIEKIEYAKETEAVLAEKKADVLIMIMMPAAVLFFLNLCSYGYIAVLYSSWAGRAVMTAALALMSGALFWSLKIMSLKL